MALGYVVSLLDLPIVNFVNYDHGKHLRFELFAKIVNDSKPSTIFEKNLHHKCFTES